MPIIEQGFNYPGENNKICPLTGEEPSFEHFGCYYTNCSDVSPDKWNTLYGQKYRCELERNQIEGEHKREVRAAQVLNNIYNSLEQARRINLDQFFHYCNDIDCDMVKNRQEYTKELRICPYHEPEDKILVYIFEDDKVVEISIVDNIFSFMASRFNALRSQNPKGAFNCCVIPGELAGAVNVRLHLQYKMDVSAILKYDNPVYLKSRVLNKYVGAAYGLTWYDFKKIHESHLEITEIVNYENIIYLKPELDEIILREKYVKEKNSN